MKYVLVVSLVCSIFWRSQAQNTIIVLNDSTKVKTDIISVSDNLLFCKAGSFNLSELYSVRFLTEEEYLKREPMADKLRELKVIVYKVNQRMSPMEPAKLTPDKNVASNTDLFYKDKGSKYSNDDESIANFGLGLGLDYGGFGGRLTFFPGQNVGVFFGGGYAVAGFGYNVGLNFRMQPKKRVVPIVNFMYGYNAAIAISGAPQFTKLYYGPSVALGVEFKSRNNMKNFFSVELVIPFRSKEFEDDYNGLKNNSSIKFSNTILPIAFSVGYHFGF